MSETVELGRDKMVNAHARLYHIQASGAEHSHRHAKAWHIAWHAINVPDLRVVYLLNSPSISRRLLLESPSSVWHAKRVHGSPESLVAQRVTRVGALLSIDNQNVTKKKGWASSASVWTGTTLVLGALHMVPCSSLYRPNFLFTLVCSSACKFTPGLLKGLLTIGLSVSLSVLHTPRTVRLN